VNVVGKALFFPDECPAYVDIVIAKNTEELALAWEGGSRNEGPLDARAFTILHVALKPNAKKFGTMFFNWADCEIPIIAHECVHAAEHYKAHFKASDTWKGMKRKDRADYEEEMLPCAVENLVSQTWRIISDIKNSQL
jgi:hypothetical protein